MIRKGLPLLCKKGKEKMKKRRKTRDKHSNMEWKEKEVGTHLYTNHTPSFHI